MKQVRTVEDVVAVLDEADAELDSLVALSPKQRAKAAVDIHGELERMKNVYDQLQTNGSIDSSLHDRLVAVLRRLLVEGFGVDS